MSGAIAIGLAGGVIAGLLGVGGGVLFVPGLVLFLGLDQHHAEATSLLAIVPVAVVGTLRNDSYGNVRRDDALVMGVLSLAGAAGGVALANLLSGAVLRDAFAALMVLVALQLVRRTITPSSGGGGGAGEAPSGGSGGGAGEHATAAVEASRGDPSGRSLSPPE